MNIREMEEKDIARVYEIEKQLFLSSPWQPHHFLAELNDNPYSKMFVLENNEEIIGYLGIWITFELCQITTIGVDLKYQGRGYGDYLMKKCYQEAFENNCETISLEVRVSNQKAINLYKKHGFYQISKRKGYYDDGEDAYVLAKAV